MCPGHSVPGAIPGTSSRSIHNRRTTRSVAEIDEDVAKEEEVASGDHRAEVLGLGAGERDRVLHL